MTRCCMVFIYDYMLYWLLYTLCLHVVCMYLCMYCIYDYMLLYCVVVVMLCCCCYVVTLLLLCCCVIVVLLCYFDLLLYMGVCVCVALDVLFSSWANWEEDQLCFEMFCCLVNWNYWWIPRLVLGIFSVVYMMSEHNLGGMKVFVWLNLMLSSQFWF